ncbi:MAG: hypothetical protein E7040_11260 [Lentisphaerae bacterium]|nr:hypothetical protein [Lentisphaerota bacterium]
MNRFRKEEMAAAKLLFEVPPTPFSWSVSRHLLFHRCRRAYFLHYYFAQGGWDPYADPLLQFAWTAKKSKTYYERLERYLEEILRFSFDSLRNVPSAFRLRMLATRFQARLTVLEERWRDDEINTFDRKRALNDLKEALASFLKSPTCSAIATAQNLTLFNKAFKPDFYFRNIELWYNPGLIWREGTHLVSMRIHFQKPSREFIRAESDMFALSALEQTNTRETISIFRYLSSSGEWKEIQHYGNAISGESRLSEDVKEMQQLITDDKVCMLDFPVEPEETCCSCRFSGVCSAITEHFGET